MSPSSDKPFRHLVAMCGLSFEEEELSDSDNVEGRHNCWNDLLTYIADHSAGYRIQQCLGDEELARVG